MKKKSLIFNTFAIASISVLTSALFLNSEPVQAKAKVAINRKKATIIQGKTLKLKIKGTKKKIKWITSNKKIAIVSKKGKVTAKRPGKATIKAKVGKITYKCRITVKKKVERTYKLNKKVLKEWNGLWLNWGGAHAVYYFKDGKIDVYLPVDMELSGYKKDHSLSISRIVRAKDENGNGYIVYIKGVKDYYRISDNDKDTFLFMYIENGEERMSGSSSLERIKGKTLSEIIKNGLGDYEV